MNEMDHQYTCVLWHAGQIKRGDLPDADHKDIAYFHDNARQNTSLQTR